MEECDTETTGNAAKSYRSLKKPGRLQQRKPKNEKHEMEVEIEVVARLGRKLSPSHRPEGLEVPEDIDK